MSALCKTCSAAIEHRFRGQGLRDTVQKVFKIELNFDGNLLCPSCLFHLDLCRSTIAEGLAGKCPKKTNCSSCDEKSRLLILYKLSGLPDSIMTLPYFIRLKAVSGCRICPKCVTMLDFVKKLAVMINGGTPTNTEKRLSAVTVKPLPLKSSIEATVVVPKPLIVAPKNISSPTLLAAKITRHFTAIPRPTASSPSQPISADVSPSHETVDVAPRPSPPPPPPATPSMAEHPEIQLPKGLTWKQLAAFVAVERLRVPPIRIRDLKLQSIMKSNSPEGNGGKRVSFDNVPPKVFQIDRRKRQSISHSSDDDDSQPLSTSVKHAGRTPPAAIRVTRSTPEALKNKRPRRLSQIINYTEPSSPIIDENSSDSDGNLPGHSKWDNSTPPSKKFRVYRPKHKEAVKTPEKSPLVINFFQNGEQGSKERAEGVEGDVINGLEIVPRPTVIQAPLFSSPLKCSPGKTANTRSRRISVDSDCVLVSDTSAASSPVKPMKIKNRRKTMNPAKSDLDPPKLGLVRVISIEKLRAPDTQINLLVDGMRAPINLPHPFTYRSP